MYHYFKIHLEYLFTRVLLSDPMSEIKCFGSVYK